MARIDSSYELSRVGPLAQLLAGRRVAITGGTAGLGLGLVREFVGFGADVAFIARNPEGVVRVAQEYGCAHGIVGDVSNKEDTHRIALQVLGALGGLDVLINNASDLGPVPLQLLADTQCEDLERALATNVVGPFRLTKTLLGSLAAAARERRGAVVLNVSSDAAVTPYPRWGAYGSSKAALRHLTLIWEQELAATGVRFISVDPGDMDTALHAAAMPDADVSSLKRPELAARELVELIAAALPIAVAPPAMAAQPTAAARPATAALPAVAAPAAATAPPAPIGEPGTAASLEIA
jgi:NAD(P)-dependent dehydrogenase (short-subunit alcohol dehydrogenase family)